MIHNFWLPAQVPLFRLSLSLSFSGTSGFHEPHTTSYNPSFHFHQAQITGETRQPQPSDCRSYRAWIAAHHTAESMSLPPETGIQWLTKSLEQCTYCVQVATRCHKNGHTTVHLLQGSASLQRRKTKPAPAAAFISTMCNIKQSTVAQMKARAYR